MRNPVNARRRAVPIPEFHASWLNSKGARPNVVGVDGDAGLPKIGPISICEAAHLAGWTN
jgi:hypothetical protein